MKQALIDCAGTIAAQLLRRTQFDLLSSTDVWNDQAHGPYELIVCSAVSASGRPLAAVGKTELQQCLNMLDRVAANRVVLISSIEVFADPRGVDEDAPVDTVNQSTQSTQLYELEKMVRQRFDALVVRVPRLFGLPIAENRSATIRSIDDPWPLAGNNGLQFYSLEWLWRDIQLALRHDLSLVHFATEPVRPFELAQLLGESIEKIPATYNRCDARSYLATLFGGHGGYLYTREQVLDEIRACVALASAGRSKQCRTAHDVAA